MKASAVRKTRKVSKTKQLKPVSKKRQVKTVTKPITMSKTPISVIRQSDGKVIGVYLKSHDYINIEKDYNPSYSLTGFLHAYTGRVKSQTSYYYQCKVTFRPLDI